MRPNLVRAVSGTRSAMDRHLGTVELDIVKACARSVFTTVDFENSAFDPPGEQLRALIGYGRRERRVLFGQNAIPRVTGTLRIGDAVEVFV